MLFPGLKYSQLKLFFTNWCASAGIFKNITFHSFRHTFATLQLELGTDIYTVSKLLGPRSLKNTEIYTKIVDKTKRQAAGRMMLKGNFEHYSSETIQCWGNWIYLYIACIFILMLEKIIMDLSQQVEDYIGIQPEPKRKEVQ